MVQKKKNIPKIPEASPSWVAVIIMAFLFPPMGGFLAVLRVLNWFRRRRIGAYRDIATVVGNKPAIDLSSLARTLGMDSDLLNMRLRAMIREGYFGEKAYLDMSSKRLVIDPDAEFGREGADSVTGAYTREQEVVESIRQIIHGAREAYRREMKKFGEEEREQAAPEPARQEQPRPTIVRQEPSRAAAQQPEKPAPETRGKNSPEDEFEAKLREIQDLNDRIKDEEVSRKIDRIGELTASIFRFAKERPDRQDEIRRFLNYYLPTTFKLLESYAMLEKQSYQGENIRSSRREIENIMDSLVGAFEQQLDRLFHADAMDISSDIEVLETMLAKDGLSEKKGLTLGGH